MSPPKAIRAALRPCLKAVRALLACCASLIVKKIIKMGVVAVE